MMPKFNKPHVMIPTTGSQSLGESQSTEVSSPAVPKGHTPGPWKQHQTEGKVYASVRGPNNETIADCGSRSDLQAQANARLIAAAPELLAICQEIANTKCDLRDSERRIRLYAAITKARGEL